MTIQEYEVDNWNSHLPLLYLALEETKESQWPILELGTGEGSTPFLNKYKELNKRTVISYETNPEYYHTYDTELANDSSHAVFFVDDWDNILWGKHSVALIDHAPGEHRIIEIERLKDKADILVIHDTETGGAGNYQYDKIWHLFKYKIHYTKFGVWASAVSNTIDVTKWSNSELLKL